MHLTTDHSSSSYGQPVLVHAGLAYGPMDLLPDGRPAWAPVLIEARAGEPTDEQRRFLRLAWAAPSEAAEALGIHPNTARGLLAKLPGRMVGSVRLVCAADLIDLELRPVGRPKAT